MKDKTDGDCALRLLDFAERSARPSFTFEKNCCIYFAGMYGHFQSIKRRDAFRKLFERFDFFGWI